MRAGLLTVFLTLVWTPAVATSSLERWIEARIQDAFAGYDILSAPGTPTPTGVLGEGSRDWIVGVIVGHELRLPTRVGIRNQRRVRADIAAGIAPPATKPLPPNRMRLIRPER